MKHIKRKYIIDENNQKVAVQLDLNTFNQIEEILENYALVQLINENDSDEILDLKSAKEYYSTLDKSN
jgi:hypothetical protein